jgi:hypothetical protein
MTPFAGTGLSACARAYQTHPCESASGSGAAGGRRERADSGR